MLLAALLGWLERERVSSQDAGDLPALELARHSRNSQLNSDLSSGMGGRPIMLGLRTPPEAARIHILDAERRLVRAAGAFGLVRTCVVDEIRSGGLK